jgi:thiamine biosynthesis lipoprotein
MASPSLETSDVSRINSAAGKNFVSVQPEIIKMLKTSIYYSKLSGGAWDVSLGPIINLWGIGTDKQRVPTDAEIKEKLALVGYEKISIDEANNTVMLQKSGMSIDLGGIAKGFAADEILKIFMKYNITSGLIDLGSSSIYALGQHDNKPWSIGIKHPRSDASGIYLGIIKISDQALSTSGDYERFFIQDNKRYHHIINPATGYPADTGVMSDTIIVNSDVSDSNMLADLLTTTVFVLGPQKGLQFINNISGIACEVTTTDKTIYSSESFKDKLQNLNSDFKLAQ